jgi:hypothetical protein
MEKARFWVGISLVFFVLALDAYLSSSHGLPSGRWGWLHRVFRNACGDLGEVVLWCSVAVLAMSYGLILALKKEPRS